MNDRSPVGVGIGQPSQNTTSVSVAALMHQLVHRQTGIASVKALVDAYDTSEKSFVFD
jgi:hypothetical protein